MSSLAYSPATLHEEQRNMNMEYTPNAERAIEGAVAAARNFNHSYVGTEHILCSILAIPNCEACRRFERLGLDPDELRLQIEQLFGPGGNARTLGDIPLTPRTKKILELAKIEAQHLKCDMIGTEHIVLAMLREGESPGAQILFQHDLDAEKYLSATPSDEDNEPMPAPEGEDGEAPEGDAPDFSIKGGKKGKDKTPALNTFGRDLTALARKGELDPVIGRKTELQRVIQVLSRRTKKILELSKIEAQHLHASAVGTEHLIIAILREGESVAAQILYGHNLDADSYIAAGTDTSADDDLPFPMDEAPSGDSSAEDPCEGRRHAHHRRWYDTGEGRNHTRCALEDSFARSRA